MVDRNTTIPIVKEHLEILYECRTEEMFSQYAAMVFKELNGIGEIEYAQYIKSTCFEDFNNWL